MYRTYGHDCMNGFAGVMYVLLYLYIVYSLFAPALTR